MRKTDPMNLEIVEFVGTSQSEFVSFWSGQYRYGQSHLYDDNIGCPLTEARVWDLFKWKNGTVNIAASKQRSIRKAYLSELPRLPVLDTLQAGRSYAERLEGGPIWNIFWLHCINPDRFPIFDQHTYRAMARIERLSPAEISASRAGKLSTYFDQYVPFTKKFTDEDPRALDKALFAYGRFLKKGLGGK